MSEFYKAYAEKKFPRKSTKSKKQTTIKSEKRKSPAAKYNYSTNANDPSGCNFESKKLLALSSDTFQEAVNHSLTVTGRFL